MTTNIKILNEGPQYVKVEVQGRNTAGQFVAAYERFIEPGKFSHFAVWEGQSLQIHEMKVEATGPATPPAPPSGTVAGESEGLLS